MFSTLQFSRLHRPRHRWILHCPGNVSTTRPDLDCGTARQSGPPGRRLKVYSCEEAEFGCANAL